MGRRKRPLPLLENVEIIDAGAEGKAVARVDERVLFVPFAAPGDIVDVQVYKKRRNYYEGRVVAFKKKSELRVEPRCSHFGLCGGCKWQHLDYEKQKYYKWKQVKDSLDRIAKVEYQEVLPIIGAENIYYYRNKLEFTFSNRRWLTENDISKEEGGPGDTRGLGFHLPGMFDKILDIEHCYLQADPSNEIRLFIKKIAVKEGYTFWDAREQHGLLRNLIIRNSHSGDVMVIVVFGEDDKEKREFLMKSISAEFPRITSLLYVINTKPNDSIYDLEVVLWMGKEYLLETMPSALEGQRELFFKVGPKSFYQTNPEQAYKLYKTAFDFAGFKGNELVYDLYTGTGTIALFMARSVRKIIGIESVKEAVDAAVINAAENKIENVEFHCGDMAKFLDEEFINSKGHPDVIVTDPPRAGMHPNVIKRILYTAPDKIVYVSCNPATQARDIALLNEKYYVRKVQPVDMFPQTHHVENVVLLQLRE
jgi:23S rRNA (uracil1939-C5)-methyltransferase